MPSIHQKKNKTFLKFKGFKPCYKWNAFNTGWVTDYIYLLDGVLNLVITGMPSIHTNNIISCF